MKTRCGLNRAYSASPSTRVRRGAHLVALELEQLAERRADALLVVDDEDAAVHGDGLGVVL